MESLPGTMYKIKGIDVGDIEYIEGKVIDGDYFRVSGDINTLGSTIKSDLIPTGRTAFMIEAKIVITTHVTPAATSSAGTMVVKDEVRADLRIDGVTKDKTNIGISTAVVISSSVGRGTGTGVGNIGDGKFNVLGLSRVGTGNNDDVNKIIIENTLDDGNAFASFSYYLV